MGSPVKNRLLLTLRQGVETAKRSGDRMDKGVDDMSEHDLYAGLMSAEKQALYEAWLVEKFGPGMVAEIENSRDRYRPSGSQEGLRGIDLGLAGCLRVG